jgi:O-acetylhomoserine/O-acetylserine sulfhydrylase-like pyridoxal-dependent enzyme
LQSCSQLTGSNVVPRRGCRKEPHLYSCSYGLQCIKQFHVLQSSVNMLYTMMYNKRQRNFESAMADLDEGTAASGGSGGKSTRSTKRS